MKSIIAFFLALYFGFGSLLPASDFEEFGKIGAMLQHYQEHQMRSNGTISFIEFLRLHYDDAKHSHAENHEKLPLKQHTFHVTQYFAFEDGLLYNTLKVYPSAKKSYPILNNNLIQDVALAIWQPPQIQA